MSDIAAEIKQARKTRGLTLDTVSKGTGLSVSYLSDIERGRTVPSVKTLRRLCAYHGLPDMMFVDTKDDDRYVVVSRESWERIMSLIGELQKISAEATP